MRWGGNDAPQLVCYPTEQQAVEAVSDFLQPYCSSLKLEPVLGNALRPDIGFRLSTCPHIPLVVECKKFKGGEISPLISAVRQAHSYTTVTGHVALIAPIEARGPLHLAWNKSPIGSIGLVAAQFSVGYLYRHPAGGGGIFIGGQTAVTFRDAHSSLHSNAETLLTRKHFSGSTTWRRCT